MGYLTSKWLRTVAATMLVAVVYYFAGYRLVYFLVTGSAKSTAAKVIKNKIALLEKLTLTESDYSSLQWTETNKEFNYNGDLYDMVSVSHINGNYIVQAYCDKNEEQWVKALNNFVKQLFPSGKPNKNVESITSAFHKDYLPLNAVQIIGPDATNTVQYSYLSKISLHLRDSGIWHPPSCSCC